jgi:hypothetical protein
MTPRAEIKKYQAEQALLKKQIEEKTGKTTQQLYAERAKRVKDTIEQKIPDRVPFSILIETQVYSGIPNSAAYYDPMAVKRAMRQAAVDLEPDMAEPGFPGCGPAMTELDVKNCLWPGGPVPDDYEYQYIEGEYMKADEYDMFLNDPTGFLIRFYLPRIYGTLSPLAKLPPMESMYQGVEYLSPLLSSPDFVKMAKKIAKAGQQVEAFRKLSGDTQGELGELGFPPLASFGAGGVGGAPFDTISSFLRGMKGSMVDMYRQPDKLLKACDAVLDRRIARARPADRTHRDYPQRIAMPLWRGDPNFMSEAQFQKFYWPGLKKSLQTHVDLGYVPVPFFEAPFRERMKYCLELPKGKILASVESTDAVSSKKILGGHTTLLVRTPLTSKLWSINQLELFLKDMVDNVGQGGGMILVVRVPDKAPLKDLQAMLAKFKEYSRY